MKPPDRRVGIAVTVLLVAVIVVLLLDVTTSSAALCGSCHEMEPSAATWAQSAHSKINCVSCHETPRPWYARPANLVERSRLLARDISRHLAGRLGEGPDPLAEGRRSPMPDEICLQCHTADRQATSGFRILIDHVEHSERTGSCVACHVHTAHPDPVLGRPLSLMTECFDCHGTAEEPDASAECATCHPSDFDLYPPDHLEQAWARDHGFSAVVEHAPCALCHEQDFCDSCHGVAMPHPDGWVGERASGHARSAVGDREVCTRCHAKDDDMCEACHHERYDPELGMWTEQHHTEVSTKGAAGCLVCHEPQDCVRCHLSPLGGGE